MRILSEKVRARRGRPQKMKSAVPDGYKLCQADGELDDHHRPRRRAPLWAVTDETMRNWLKQAVKRAETDGVHFSIPVTPHTFRHSYIMHMLYHRQPGRLFRRWLVTGIRARWRCIRGCSRWTWPPHWLCRSPVTGMMPDPADTPL
ncbi:hypothetical protein BANRA_04812 [Escherichia coli]|nr:hypothetical protein BANRA_04812 [Escherichia coli]